MLRRFQMPFLEQEGYVNIRCAWSLGCPSEIRPFAEEGEHRAQVHAGGDYKEAFQVLFPGVDVPEYVGVSCCAQFAATKEKIRQRKKSDYERYRDWLLKTDLEDSISGRIMEYSWHSTLPSSQCQLSHTLGWHDVAKRSLVEPQDLYKRVLRKNHTTGSLVRLKDDMALSSVNAYNVFHRR
jgi:hypothetical protein